MRYYNHISNRINPFEVIYRKFNNTDIPSFPYVMDIELTNNCNSNCIFCGQQTMKRNKGYMNDDVFYKSLEECVKHKTPIRFIRWGEPTIHPKSLEYSKDIIDAGLLLHITTNGIHLTPKYLEELIDINLHSITFSFQGTTKKEYEFMRNNHYYDSLVQNIMKLVEYRGKKPYPYIQISTTLTSNDNEYNTEKFYKYWVDELGVDLVSIGNTDLSRININDIESKEIRDKMRLLKGNRKKLQYRLNCPDMFSKLSIDWDGKITACCSDYDNYLTIGDINKNKIEDVWNGENLKAMRVLMKGNMHHCLSLCSTCFSTEVEIE